MTYPLSTDVTAGQPTAAAHHNNLRRDALTLGNAPADSLDLVHFFNRHAEHVTIQYLATARLRVPYAIGQPPTLMINGYLLQATANVDLAASQFSGAAATWYVFAVRSANSTTFTLAVNTSAAEATDQRLIGEAVWDGSAIASVKCYFTPSTLLPAADYDSGWFAVAGGNTYTKAHSLGQVPRIVTLLWCNSSNGAGANYQVTVAYTNNPSGGLRSVLSVDSTNFVVTTGAGGNGTLEAIAAQSNAGYYRIQAWK